MDSIKIDTLRDILIIEKSKDKTIMKGSHIYCGCCGKTIGRMKYHLKSPFKPHDFLDALKNKTVDWMIFGLRHKLCGHSMFCFQKTFHFITLENYNKQLTFKK